jgi:hypothetical protein
MNYQVSDTASCYPLTNEVVKGYSNATIVRPSVTSL